MNHDDSELPPGDPLQAAIRALREPVPISDGLARRTADRRRRARLERITRSVTALAIMAVAATMVWHRSASGTTVTFAITAPSVQSVVLVGDFTDWRTDRVQLARNASGSWYATVKLSPGRYRYAYLVDHAEWRADAHAPSAPDDFGRPTSILTVAGK